MSPFSASFTIRVSHRVVLKAVLLTGARESYRHMVGVPPSTGEILKDLSQGKRPTLDVLRLVNTSPSWSCTFTDGRDR